MMKLNLGGGNVRKEGFKNVDLYVDADYKWDLFNGLPPEIKDNSVDYIIASHIFEHIPETIYQLKKRKKGQDTELVAVKSRIKLMQECWRVLKPGAMLEIWTPHRYDSCMYTDPTHVWYMGHNSLDQFCADPSDHSKLFFENYIRSYEYEPGKKYTGTFIKTLEEGIEKAHSPYYSQPIPTQIHWILEAKK